MMPLLGLTLCSFVLAFLLTPICRDLALRYQCVDRPDSHRKLHQHPVPRIGGVPLMAACALSLGALLPSVLVIFVAGLWDDLVGLRARRKLLLQACASAMACIAGIRIGSDAWWSVPLTIIWLVGCSNAFNLIDGLDGLAGGLGLISALTILAAGLLHGHHMLAFVAAPVAGALGGFLPYNFRRASVFLGDCGSLTLGFLLGIYAVVWSNDADGLPGVAGPLLALSVPLLDTALAIVRRLLSGQPVFGADRRHIHHRLLDRGMTPRSATLLLWGICGAGGMLSIVLATAPAQVGGLVIVIWCAAAWAGIQQLGYSELDVARRLQKEAGESACPTPAGAYSPSSSFTSGFAP